MPVVRLDMVSMKLYVCGKAGHGQYEAVVKLLDHPAFNVNDADHTGYHYVLLIKNICSMLQGKGTHSKDRDIDINVVNVKVEVLKVLVCDIQVVQHFTRPHHTVICHVVS